MYDFNGMNVCIVTLIRETTVIYWTPRILPGQLKLSFYRAQQVTVAKLSRFVSVLVEKNSPPITANYFTKIICI
jgi:hypothetical protein